MSETEATTADSSERDVPALDEEVHDTADRIVRRYPVSRSALLPLLHLVQSVQNHITDEGIAFCAEKVGLTRAEVGAVATFYTMYKRQPVGDWLLSVCTNPPCKIAGGQEIYDNYVDALGGHNDPDTKVTVEHAECLGICDGAPVVQVNYEMFGPMTVAEGQQLLESCRKGDPPTSPWSGEKPPTFAEVEYDLSGANDAWEDELHRAALQQIAFAEPPTYRTGETDLPVTHPGGDPAGVGGAAFRDAAAGNGRTALGRPEAPVDADESEPTPMIGDTAQRIGEDVMGDLESAEPGTPGEGEADVPVEEATAHVSDVPGDAEALTVEAATDSSTAADDARATAAPTVDAAPTDDAARREPTAGSGEAADREHAEVAGPEDDTLTADDTADDAGVEADASTAAATPGPADVTAGEAAAVPGSIPSGPMTESLQADAAAVEIDEKGKRVHPDEDDGGGDAEGPGDGDGATDDTDDDSEDA